ncbi:MAG: hypothetical protein Ct9H300mP14_02520 [Gammaproteobacteria bacterium]|nr:MAG: hypothetical protein Ct9H300mP14_02520 [Gammaproteobacteria bacterium]
MAGLLTASAVTLAGAIGFVGLFVPHMVRLWGGSDHRLVLPGSVLLGGVLLVLAEQQPERSWRQINCLLG